MVSVGIFRTPQNFFRYSLQIFARFFPAFCVFCLFWQLWEFFQNFLDFLAIYPRIFPCILSGTYFYWHFKTFIFQPNSPTFFHSKFLFSRSLIIKTRQDIHFWRILIHGVVNLCASTLCLLRTLLVHNVAEVLQLCVNSRQAEIPKLNVQNTLRHLRRNRLQQSRLPICSQTTSVLLSLDRSQVPYLSVTGDE